MPRKSVEDGSNPRYRNLPQRRQGETSGTLPSVADCERLPHLIDVLLRQRVYLALWAGADGAVIFLDLLNGADRRRYSARDQRELRDVVAALHAEFFDGQVYG
jgi:hypothetical protein